MKSRRLEMLNVAIAAQEDGAGREILLAERVAYLARLGNIGQAREEISRLRARAVNSSAAEVSILLHIADGLCHYYSDMGPEARDRFLRAHAIASAAGIEMLRVRAASWLALIEYGLYEFDSMVKYLDESLCVAAKYEYEALARSCLSVALTLHLSNRFDLASVWYRKVRLLSAEIEDDATISALLHNLASMWCANARNSTLGGIKTIDSTRQALFGAMSTLNFDDMVGLSTLGRLTPLMQAQIFSLENNYSEALALYEVHLRGLEISALSGWQAWLRADKGWCLFRVGRVREAQESLDIAIDQLKNDSHIDDQAAVFSRVAAFYRKVGNTLKADEFNRRAEEGWKMFVDLQLAMMKTIELSSGIQWASKNLYFT